MNLRQYCYSRYINFVHNHYKISTNELSESNQECITTFLIELHKKIGLAHIGENYINDYLIYQFNYWIDKDVQFGNSITIKKVFAIESLKRYLNRDPDFNWYMAKLQIEPYLTPIKEIKAKSDKLNDTEENEKRRFYNEKRGLIHCFDTTTLFNHNSPLCISCIHKEVCKKLLMNTYPKIYKERGY